MITIIIGTLGAHSSATKPQPFSFLGAVLVVFDSAVRVAFIL